MNENVCITCFADDLMSRWHCQMKDFFFLLHPNIPCQFIFCFICSVAWGSVTSNQPAVIHSDDNKWRHYHFYTGPSLKRREDEVFSFFFVRWRNNLWSFYVPLRTLENNNTPQQKHTNSWKGTKCYKSDGICIFCLPSKEAGRRKSHIKTLRSLGFTWRRVCFSSTTGLWLKTWGYQGGSLLKRRFILSVLRLKKLKVEIPNQIMCRHVLIWPFFLFWIWCFSLFFPTGSFLPRCFIAAV